MLPTQVILQSLLDYDPNTGHLFWKARLGRDHWNKRYAGKRAFTATTAKGYHTGSINGHLYRANRVIFKLIHGIEPDQVDHEDGNNQNDRIDNLRNVTNQQNQMNMKRASNNTSGCTGVIWDDSRQMWQSRIKVNQKTIHLGRFEDFSDAVKARKDAETKYGFHKNHGR